MKSTTPAAYRLMHEGALALARVEANGIRIDVAHCEREMEAMQQELDGLQEQMLESELGGEWKKAARRSGRKLSLQKEDQLRAALYDGLGMRTERRTAKGMARPVDADTLREYKSQVQGIDFLLEWRTLRVARNTFLKSLLREQRDEVIHPFFNLHLVKTFRSSSDSPNFQNQPKRDKKIMRRIRAAFVPRPGRQLIDVDYSGVEVRVSCFYHSDPNLMAYVSDPKKDMHRDMAMENFMLPADEINKELRHSGKNETVFPWFYGDWPGSTGPTIWESAASYKTASGKQLRKHLKEQGLGSMRKFMNHHQAIYDDFWGKRFKVYAQWKERVWKDYVRNGYVEMLAGFRCQDIAAFNEVINRPIQGTAFHLLLWSLTRLQEELERRQMETLIVGQVHDNILFDAPPDEIEDVIQLCKRIMTKRIRKHWGWINVPLKVDIEASDIDGSWAEMKEIKI